MRAILAKGDIPHLWAFPSSAVTLCRAAEEAGIDITGARFTITGEPVTTTRLSAIRRAGAVAVPDYGSADSGGSVTYGCLSPEAPDDVHLFQDLNALIQADAAPFPSGALLISSLRPTVPFMLLNVSMGNCATVTDPRVGAAGPWRRWARLRHHFHTIRSFEKLTAGGMDLRRHGRHPGSGAGPTRPLRWEPRRLPAHRGRGGGRPASAQPVDPSPCRTARCAGGRGGVPGRDRDGLRGRADHGAPVA